MTTQRAILVRYPDTLIDRIDARAGQAGVTRAEWLRRAATWALDQPIRERDITVTERT